MLPTNDPAIILQSLVYLGLIGTLGYAVICAALKPGTRNWIELLALSFCSGAGVLPLVLFVCSLAGFKPSRFILGCVAVSALLFLARAWKHQNLIKPNVPSRRHSFDALTLLGLLGAALLAAAAFNIAAHAAWPGLQDIDSFAIWMLKAKWVTIEALHPMPAAFRDPILSYSHQDYPLSLPLLIAGLYAIIGHIDDNAAKLLLMPVWASLVGIIYSAVRRFHRRAVALAVTAVFATAPTLTANAALLVAETPLLLALAGTSAQLLRWIEDGDPGDLILAALFAAMAAFTKNEGLALLPFFAIAALVVALARRAVRDWAIAAAVGAVAIAPWLVFRIWLPRTHEDYGSKLLSASVFFHNLPLRYEIILQYFARFFDAPRVGLIWYVLLLTTLLAPRALLRASVRVLWFLLLVQLSLYLATYIVTPWDLRELVPMITPKLQTQASAIAALLIAMNLRDIKGIFLAQRKPGPSAAARTAS